MKSRLLRMLAVVAMAAFLAAAVGAQPARAAAWTFMVKPAGLTTGTCSDWANACDLQYALTQALAGDEVWVKKGFYRPSTTDPAATFTIKPGVEVYGGFAGTEGLSEFSLRNWNSNRTILSGDMQRNDVNTDGNRVAEKWTHIRSTNSYHVVTLRGDLGTPIISTTVLDGFIITAGDRTTSTGAGLRCFGQGATHECSPTLANLIFSGNRAREGGGLFLDASSSGKSSPTLSNITFRGNYAENYGGGMANTTNDNGVSNPVLTGATFTGNYAGTNGGGMYSLGVLEGFTYPSLTNVTFVGNVAGTSGGGIYSTGQQLGAGSPTLKNVTFSRNRAGIGGAITSYAATSGASSPTLTNVTFNANEASVGGAMYNNNLSGGGWANPVLRNVILWGDVAGTGPEFYNSSGTPDIDYSVVQGTCAAISGATCGSHNLDENPQLKALANNGGLTQTMLLKATSPAIDVGTNTGCPIFDQRGQSRPQGASCDIGAVEARHLTAYYRSQGANDGWVLESAQGTALGGSHNDAAETLRFGDDENNRQSRIILSFNTAGLPDGTVVASARVLVKDAGLVGNPFGVLGVPVVDIKLGSFGTAEMQNGDFQAVASAHVITFLTDGAIAGWHHADVPEYALVYVSKTGVTQFRLRFAEYFANPGGADYYTAYSGNATALDRPQLIVTYIVP